MGSEDQTQVPVFALQAHNVWAISQPHLTNIFLMDNEDLDHCSKLGGLNSRFREPSFMLLELGGWENPSATLRAEWKFKFNQ